MSQAVQLSIVVFLMSPVYWAGAWPPPVSDPRVFEAFDQLADHTDWDAEYPNIVRAIDNIWQRNGWNDESDIFARDLARELTAIPPWEPIKRLNVFGDRVAERYGLAEGQAQRFKSTVIRETANVLARNAGVMIRQVTEGMQARANGEPFTAEQVARWSKAADPALADLHERIDRLREELAVMVPPERQTVLERDVASYRKRRAVMDEMGKRWAAGNWRPDDWGMQNDPIQTGQHSAARLGAGVRHVGEAPQAGRLTPPTPLPKWLSYEPTTWLSYVVEFRRKYGLEKGQVTTADSIHSELLARATNYVEDHAVALQAVPAEQRVEHEAYKPIVDLFGQLKERLDAIPTTAQRQRAEQ